MISDTFLYLIINVKFSQRKLRIARDTTVNDYLCCNGVLLGNVWAHLPHSSLTNDTCDLSDSYYA